MPIQYNQLSCERNKCRQWALESDRGRQREIEKDSKNDESNRSIEKAKATAIKCSQLNTINILFAKRGTCSYMLNATQYIVLDIDDLNIKFIYFQRLFVCVFYCRHFIGLILLSHLYVVQNWNYV